MNTLLLQLLNPNTIKLLFKKKSHWYFKIESPKKNLRLQTDIESFLAQNKQFIQISNQNIVNLNYLDDYLLDAQNSFFIIAGEHFPIQKDYIEQVKLDNKNFLHEKYFTKFSDTEKAIWISKQTQFRLSDNLVNILDSENIKYMVRIGFLTEAHYIDRGKRCFYDTLKYFEQCFKANSSLIRVNRNYIINIDCIESYRIFTQTKTGEVSIDSEIISISRRQLPKFRKLIKRSGLIVLKQKGV